MNQARAEATNAISIYMADLEDDALLTAAQEIELAKQYERARAAKRQIDQLGPSDMPERERLQGIVRKGERARQRLIRCNLRLVISLAKRYRGLGLSLGDLIQEGNIGLIKAVERYDYRRGFRFATYAGHWIRQTIRRALSSQSQIVRLPEHINQKLRQLRRAQRELELCLHCRPTSQELAEHTGMSISQVRRLVLLERRKILSLDMPVGDEGNSELGDLVPDREAPPIEEVCAERCLRQGVQDIVAKRLPPREQRVLCMRFGLDSGQSQTLKQIAEELGVTRERVRQIEKRALRRLRHTQTQYELRKAWSQS
jgi:DNA-directed RNA polymerase sigma subunit (sigma70/sigma32)